MQPIKRLFREKRNRKIKTTGREHITPQPQKNRNKRKRRRTHPRKNSLLPRRPGRKTRKLPVKKKRQ